MLDPHPQDAQAAAEIQARIDALLRQGKNVYQPLYNYPYRQKIAPLRLCSDRCEAVRDALPADIAGLRLLDVGCSLGFNTLYFADRGMVGHGIDVLARNVALCREMQAFTQGTHQFWQASFDQPFVEGLADDAYDVAFLFSVLHHIVEAHGLAYVQTLLQTLLTRVPVLFVELAQRVETPPPGYTWDMHQPEDALTLFALCPDVEITLVGHFPTHVGPVNRPLYRVSTRPAAA